MAAKSFDIKLWLITNSRLAPPRQDSRVSGTGVARAGIAVDESRWIRRRPPHGTALEQKRGPGRSRVGTCQRRWWSGAKGATQSLS